jgi:hypothetical protein
MICGNRIKLPAPVEPDVKSVKQEELRELSSSSYPEGKWRRDLIRNPEIHS